MSSSRRDFLKKAALSAGMLATSLPGCQSPSESSVGNTPKPGGGKHQQRFNMSGFAAPRLDVVRVGIIGLGNRGLGAVQRLSYIEGVEIKALCDKVGDRVDKAQQILVKAGLPEAKKYAGSEHAWQKLCEDPEIDLVYIATPWDWHTPMAVYAMENNKHAATEVPAAITLEEAWQLVETSERTKKHCMMLENCCYGFFELLTLNMARQGVFGDLVHAEGAYIHNLLGSNFSKDGYMDMWRLKENFKNGNRYPTHGLGPVCQALNVNRGDQMDYLTSMSSNDFQMGKMAHELAQNDAFFKPFANQPYRGNMNTTAIRTHLGRTIMVQHDVTSTRPYSRIHLLSGTLGVAQKYPEPARIALGHNWLSDEEMKPLWEKYTPEIVTRVGEMARKVGGHGGMDFLMDWRLIDSLRNGLALDQNVYDAALWSVITPLSEWSVTNRSQSIDVPDFTCGAWKTNAKVELTLIGGGTTGVRSIKKGSDSKQLNI